MDASPEGYEIELIQRSPGGPVRQRHLLAAWWKCRQHRLSSRAGRWSWHLNVTPDSFSDGGDSSKPTLPWEQGLS